MLKRVALSVLLLLALVAPRPAVALVDPVSIATNVIGLSLTPAGWATSIGAAVRIAVESYFETIMAAVQAKGEFDAEQAEAVVETHIQKRALQLGFQIANMQSPAEGTCRATTTIRRERESRAESDGAAAADFLAGESEILRRGQQAQGGGAGAGAGGGTGAGDGGGAPPAPPRGLSRRGTRTHEPGGSQAVDAIQERATRCQMGVLPDTPDNRRLCEGVQNVRYDVAPNADTDAVFFLGSVALDNERHRDIAMAYCRNLTFNRTIEIPSADVARRSVDGTTRSQAMLAERAAASLAQMVCEQAIGARQPRARDYDAFVAMTNASVEDNCDQETNPLNRRYCKNMRKFGWEPITSAAAFGAEWPPKVRGNPTTITGNNHFIPGRSPSLMQSQIMSVNALNDDSRFRTVSSNMTNAVFFTILAKSVTLSQEFQKFKNMERQLLFEAVRLARNTQNRGR